MTERIRIHILWAIVALIIGLKVVSQFEPSAQPETITIDSTAYKFFQVKIDSIDAALSVLKNKKDSIQIKRINVREQILRYTDDDCVVWAKRFSTEFGCDTDIYIQADYHPR